MTAQRSSNLIRDCEQSEETETADMTVTMELLQNVLNSIDVGVVVIGADDRIVIFNNEAGRMLSEDPQKRMGESILLCHPKTSEEKVRQFIDQFRRDPQYRFKRQLLNYQGRYLEEDFFSLVNDEGKYVGLVELLYDATDKVSLLKQLGKFAEPHISGVGSRAPPKTKL